jgi:hypothetical protein
MVDAIIAAKGGTIVVPPFTQCGSEWVKVRCAQGHEWIPRVANLIHSDSWCPDCYGNRRGRIEDLHAWARELGGRCLSEIYSGNKTKYGWECGQCEHQWEAAWYNIKCHSSWCPNCKTSIRELITRAAFCENFPGETFAKDLTTIGMELDGFSAKNMLAFEHDGLQHRERVPHFQPNEGDFEAQQARDRRKDELCAGALIALIRVPDRRLLAHRAIRDHVRAQLEELGYDLPTELPDDAAFYATVRAARGSSPYLDEAAALVAARGGELLSERCPTRTWPLHARCRNGHEFETYYDNLVRGRGCVRCTDVAPKEETELEAAAAARGYEFLYTEHRCGADGRSRRYITLQCPDGSHEPFDMLWDNFRKGRGCTPCGRARTGAGRRCGGAAIEDRLRQVGMALDGEYTTLNKAAIFICPEDHRFTSTLNKLEMAPPDARCPACTAAAFGDVELLDPYTPETNSAKTKLRWRCVTCNTVTTTTYRGMRIRKYRCGNKHCPARRAG